MSAALTVRISKLSDAHAYALAYVRERKLFQTCPLNALSSTRLGIDAAHYIKTLLSEPDSREPLVAATGGIPLALVARIEADLRSMESLRIRPVFVFAGLPASARPPQKGMDPLAARETNIKDEAWMHYENGEVDRAIMTLTQIRGGAWTDWRDLVRSILRIFRHRFVEYLVAPYMEFAQVSPVSYMLPTIPASSLTSSLHTC